MRVDGTNNIDPRPLPESAGANARTPKHAEGLSFVGEGLEIKTSYEAYARLAAQADELDARAIEEARRLLASGQLDTPQAAMRAAAAMVDTGL